jgi:DNA invertase Pin-like site-specific DNA recombinase
MVQHASPPIPRLIGYARVSTEDQATRSQVDTLKAAGCHVIHEEHASGASSSRPVLASLLASIGRGDVLVVVRLDRLARSVSHLLDVICQLETRGAHFRSLSDPIDTSSPQGMFTLQVLGAVAQLERALNSERTKAGIKAAVARGRRPGNPGLRARDPRAIQKTRSARDHVHLTKLLSGLDDWLPTVKRMRPDHSWDDIARMLNARLASNKLPWTSARLRRSVKRLIKEGLASPLLLQPMPQRVPENRLLNLVAGISIANDQLTLRQIATQLEAMHERTPRGGVRWSPSSVKHLLDRARKIGVLPI